MATTSMAPNQLAVKLHVGLEMLGENETGEYGLATTMLSKILGNIAASPEQEKFRSLRVSNAKVSNLLATRGVRALLTGVGFVQEGDSLCFPAAAPLDNLQQAIGLLQAQQVQRDAQANAENAQLQAQRKEQFDKAEEARKRLKSQIADDAESRKEPGWKAKAAGVKDGKAITGCGDIGIGGDSGG